MPIVGFLPATTRGSRHDRRDRGRLTDDGLVYRTARASTGSPARRALPALHVLAGPGAGTPARRAARGVRAGRRLRQRRGAAGRGGRPGHRRAARQLPAGVQPHRARSTRRGRSSSPRSAPRKPAQRGRGCGAGWRRGARRRRRSAGRRRGSPGAAPRGRSASGSPSRRGLVSVTSAVTVRPSSATSMSTTSRSCVVARRAADRRRSCTGSSTVDGVDVGVLPRVDAEAHPGLAVAVTTPRGRRRGARMCTGVELGLDPVDLGLGQAHPFAPSGDGA